MRVGDESAPSGAGAAGKRPASPAPAAVEPRVGDRIGPYRLVRLLGAGAAGRVFEVEHQRLGRRAAMKTLAAAHAAHPSAIKRLFAEARAVNRINNPHIVEVTDLVEAGEHRRAPAFAPAPAGSQPINAIVMEVLDGQSLAQAMVREGPLEPERFLSVLAQVARALAAAHTAGFVHRDLKPDNIFLVNRGRQHDFVKLLDFGLARALGSEAGRLVDRSGLGDTPGSSLDGIFVGTPAYVSPEQASGRTVDHRGDIYALGVILYELVTGRLPFEGPNSADILVQHVSTPAPHLPADVRVTKLGGMLDTIVQRCMEKDPAARFPSAAPLARMFDDLARGGDIAFTGIGGYLARRPARRDRERREIARAVVGIGVGMAMALVLGGVIINLRASAQSHLRASARDEAGARAARAAAAAAPVAAPVPATIALTFESDPTGAEVFVDQGRGRERLGTTPFQRAFPRRAQVVTFEFDLAGHEPMHVPTPLTSDRTISTTLTREP